MDFGLRVCESDRRKAVWGGVLGRAIAAVAVVSMTSCGDLTREGTASSYLIVSALEGASGAQPSQFGGTLQSDVVTIVDDVPTIFNDLGRVRLQLAMKDPGSAGSATNPTTANFITVDRYRVRYTRADGRNTPGVDVPYPFDGAFTATVSGQEVTVGFELVRHIAKQEAPLAALAGSPVIISTLAEVTFYGHDQTGREVSVLGRLTVDFGNFGDPG
jgi:hypothetical protein